ncbi:unnamed protein product [Timema podura]|uniref:Uncharacterized protein n=1 Tax=Timema podura TaxID=61482 RepID=A0ABN7NHK0_TIMPD|nr:unnamed protein product [Timema podura]
MLADPRKGVHEPQFGNQFSRFPTKWTGTAVIHPQLTRTIQESIQRTNGVPVIDSRDVLSKEGDSTSFLATKEQTNPQE